ncbi:MAG: DUF4160 domain-containing protein [Bacteroidales bacterium]|nr:DUF4160 domain-containing protein [Bacteroidales bacterium]
MSKVYRYLGIDFSFPAGDHLPIHAHVTVGNNVLRIFLYEKDGVVTYVKYEVKKGKFTPAQMRSIKKFISVKKDSLLFAYKQLQAGNKVTIIEITTKIK